MKEKIEIADYAQTITKALPKGILLNTQGEKFNSMVIGWGNLGTTWGGGSRVCGVCTGKPLYQVAA